MGRCPSGALIEKLRLLYLIHWLSRTEQHALLRRVERYGSTRDLGAVKLLLNTGLRVSELEALHWCDITMSERKGNLTVRSGKGCKRREVPLNPGLLIVLSRESFHQNEKPYLLRPKCGFQDGRRHIQIFLSICRIVNLKLALHHPLEI